MKKIELLSPAGNFECLKQAINNGADAVYLGCRNFSARAFADNFDDAEVVQAIKYAHLRGVKVYVTMNTLLNEFEIENAYKECKLLYENNVDALLIQDLGLFYRLRRDFPDLELHASTQLHIHNLQGVKNAKELGFKRVVLARESDSKLIEECAKEDIEIETFVHGAICVSYSGQCLMSSVTKNRSANKGMCAQCCRLKYTLYEDNKKVSTDTDYLLSPKDMRLINDIPELIKIGVSSLKIEGRMKSPAYVGYVTSIYRKAIDSYYENKKFILTDEMSNNLKLLFNRGFTNTYFKNDEADLFSNYRPNHMGVHIGKVVDVKDNCAFIKLDREINQFDGIRFINNDNDSGLILNMLKVNDLLVNHADINQVIEVNLKDSVSIGDEVIKTIDYKLEKEIAQKEDKKIPIDLTITSLPNKPISIKCLINNHEFNFCSNALVDKAIKQPITETNFIDSFKSVDEHPYYLKNYNVILNNSFVPLKKINDIRRDFYNQLDEYVLSLKTKTKNDLIINDEILNFEQINNLTKDSLGNFNPVINKESNYFDKNNVVTEFGGILLKGDKNAYYTMNISNSYAFEFLLKLGFKNIILSSELVDSQIEALANSFKNRNNLDIKPYVMISGKRVLMHLNRNPFKKYINSNKNVRLSDGNNVYLIKFADTETSIQEIENSIKISPNNSLFYTYTE